MIYQERVDQDENKNDAYIILLSEKEHYQKGKELLMSRSLPRFLFEDDSKIGMNAYEKIRKGEILDVPLAILKNNTYISSKDGKKYMHAWNDMIRMVRIVGTDPKGMLLTEVYDESI